jgi:hypothetical protein
MDPFWPEPVATIRAPQIVREAVAEESCGTITIQIRVEDKGLPDAIAETNKNMFTVDTTRASSFLGVG